MHCHWISEDIYMEKININCSIGPRTSWIFGKVHKSKFHQLIWNFGWWCLEGEGRQCRNSCLSCKPKQMHQQFSGYQKTLHCRWLGAGSHIPEEIPWFQMSSAFLFFNSLGDFGWFAEQDSGSLGRCIKSYDHGSKTFPLIAKKILFKQ